MELKKRSELSKSCDMSTVGKIPSLSRQEVEKNVEKGI